MTLTRWNLPRLLLEALPESARALAGMAAEAYDVDLGAMESGDDQAPKREQARRYPRSVVDLAEADGGRQDEKAAALVGMRLQLEFNPGRLMNEIGHDIVVPAIDRGDGRLLYRCCDFLEAVLQARDGELRDAVVLGLLESSVFTESRWNALKSAAGPLLRREMDS